MRGHVHRLAAAGNAAALFVLVLVAAILAEPFEPPPRRAPAALAAGAASASAPPPRVVVLVVIDGLRADVARDRGLMPFLSDLAARGGAGTARVEALIPSSVAGVTTLATGVVPHPASFLHDFRAPPARSGGLFEALAGRGGRSFVAGATLWSDLYGRWADVAHAAAPLGAPDEPALRAGLAALDDPAYRLGVFHFGGPDEAAHLHGAKSTQYARAAAWCDDAVRQVVDRAGPAAAVVVTSDHGVTDAGGHAGPEPEVLDTPVVMFGPGLPTGTLPPMAQRDVPKIIARALGIESLSAAPGGEPRRARLATGWIAAGTIVLAGVCALAIWIAIAAGADGWPHAFWLNLTLWLALGLLVAGQFTAAAALATAALAATTFVLWRRGARLWRAPGGTGTHLVGQAFLPASRRGSQPAIRFAAARALAAGPSLAFALGCAWALLRISLEWGGSDVLLRLSAPVSLVLLAALWLRSPRRHPRLSTVATAAVGAVGAQAVGGAGLALTFVVGLAIARFIGVRFQATSAHPVGSADDDAGGLRTHWPGFGAGASLALGTSLAAMAAGQSLSLSTIDVATAYHAAVHGGGLPVAIAVVFLAQALPPAALAIGFMVPARRWSPGASGAVFVGMSAMFAGEALAAASCLLGADDLRIQSLSLGGLLRSAVAMIFLTCATGVVLLTRRGDAPPLR